MRIENLQNENRKYAKSIGNFHVLEYVQDASVSPMNAMNEYFMSKMNVRRRQVSGEGLVNVYRGTGRVLMCPVAPTTSLFESTNTMAAKAAAKSSNTFGK